MFVHILSGYKYFTMNEFCLNLNINIEDGFVPGAREKLCVSTDVYHDVFYVPIEDDTVFKPEWVEKMRSIGLPFEGAGIIPFTADLARQVHVDGSRNPNKIPVVAFNVWLHKPNNTHLVWYKWPKEVPIRRITRPTIWFWDEDVEHEEVYRDPLSFEKLCAIRIDIPHTATLHEPGIAMSFRTPMGYYTSWDQVIDRLAPYIIN